MSERDPELVYRRHGDAVRVRLHNLTNHELHEVLTGLFARLDKADRWDHLAVLVHYSEMLDDPKRYPDRHLSPLARAVSHDPDNDPDGFTIVDLTKIGEDR